MTVISFPIPAYSNVPIRADFYQPRRFEISAITTGVVTLVETAVDHDYVIGQLVRLIIPAPYGSRQLNEQQGYVILIPNPNEVVIDISSINSDPFIPTPYTAIITNATQTNPCVVTSNNFFKMNQLLTISEVQGMTELNGVNRLVLGATSTTITLDIDATAFGAYTMGGLALLQEPIVNVPQILAIGDVGNGQVNATGRRNTGTFIPGSFINISPQ
jgi:hypothetical protein